MRAVRVGRPGRRAKASDRAWQRSRHAGLRWAAWGTAIGAVVGLVGWPPAAWLAEAIDQASGGHLQLADAAGTIWSGDAVLMLTGGAGSRDAAALPGRLQWSLRPAWGGLSLRARHACCLERELGLDLSIGWNGSSLRYAPAPAAAGPATSVGRWPAAWLAGLGTPWNTLQPGGTLRLSSPGLQLQWSGRQLHAEGELVLDVDDLASRVSPLPVLGSYRVLLRGRAGADEASIDLATREGSLLLSGQGRWNADGLRFRGEARAAPGQETVLSNLLNIIGRRQGALSVISIG